MKFKKNLLLGNYGANLNQTLLKWFLDGPLPKLCPVIPNSNQDGRQAKNRKGGMKFKKIFSKTTEPISTNLCWNDPWVDPFQNCVRQCRAVSKMATITKNRNFFKWPKLLYVKPESAQNLNCISIMMSFLTYITGFFMNFELLPILTDYAN